MKTTIKLTNEQIQVLMGAKEKQLTELADREISKIKTGLTKDIEALKKKFENFEVNLDEEEVPKKKRTPIDETELRKLVAAGKTKSEVAKALGKSYASIDQKMKKMGLKAKTKGK